MSQNYLYPFILLCPAFYCVHLYTVSNTLLCPARYCVQRNSVSTLTQRSFVHLSHFNVLGRIMLRLPSTSVNKLVLQYHSTTN